MAEVAALTTRPTATITLSGLRRLTGAEAGELEALIASGAIPPEGREQRVPMVEAIHAYLGHLREASRTASASAAMARARVTRDLRERRQIEDCLRLAQESIAQDLAQLPD